MHIENFFDDPFLFQKWNLRTLWSKGLRDKYDSNESYTSEWEYRKTFKNTIADFEWSYGIIVVTIIKEPLRSQFSAFTALILIPSDSWFSNFMPGWHSGLMSWLIHCRFAPNQGRTTLCCLYVAVYASWLRCVTRSTHVCIIHGGVNCLNSVPYRCFQWTAVWLQLHASLVHVSACSFAVSQESELALLVGYVA